jgi:hypothetical protein
MEKRDTSPGEPEQTVESRRAAVEREVRAEAKRLAEVLGISEEGAEMIVRQARGAGPRPDGTIIDT